MAREPSGICVDNGRRPQIMSAPRVSCSFITPPRSVVGGGREGGGKEGSHSRQVLVENVSKTSLT